MVKILQKIDKFIENFSSLVLVISVFVMLFLSVLTIVFRWFNVTCLWFEPLVRHLVFLSAFLGGVLATGRGTHIGIDIVSKYLESKNLFKIQQLIKRIILLASCLTLCWLIVGAYRFVLMELQYGRASFLNIHSGYLVMIIPFGFSLMAYRFLFKFVLSFSNETKAGDVY